MPSFTSLPYEVHLIILHELVDSFLAAPELLRVLLTCRSIHDLLVGAPAHNIHPRFGIFSQLFHRFFDSAAPIRRLNRSQNDPTYIKNSIFADIWKRRCRLLRRIVRGIQSYSLSPGLVDSDELAAALWEIYFMLLDDDGKNMFQLELANTASFLNDTIYLCLQDQDENEWPKETMHFQLAAACFSIISDRASVLQEGDEQSRRLTDALMSIHVAPHRYPCAFIPLTKINKSELYEEQKIHAETLPSIANMRLAEPVIVNYFGKSIPFVAPLLLPSVACIILNRVERIDMIPAQILSANREEAIARGLTMGATKADWAEINLLRRLAIGTEVPRAGSGRENLSRLLDAPLGSTRWDHMFERMLGVGRLLSSPDSSEDWFDTVYQPGMFSGNWLGRLLVPEWDFHNRLLEMHPQSYSSVFRSISDQPPAMMLFIFQATLKEHVSENHHVSRLGGQGIDNAYFPFPINGRTRSEIIRPTEKGVVVEDPFEKLPMGSNLQNYYQDWDANAGLYSKSSLFPPGPSSQDTPLRSTTYGEIISDSIESVFDREGVGASVPRIDIIVTGESDYAHGLAWGKYRFYGRVRKLDGLLVLVRVSTLPDQEYGCWVFSGYIYLANVIIGSWKAGGTSVESVGMQSIFMISKVGPAIQIEDPYYRLERDIRV